MLTFYSVEPFWIKCWFSLTVRVKIAGFARNTRGSQFFITKYAGQYIARKRFYT